MDMLKYLTHKLRSQSLNEISSFQPTDEDRDSGTESDEENAELAELEQLSELQSGVAGRTILPQPRRSLSSPTLVTTTHSDNTFQPYNVEGMSQTSETLSDPIAEQPSSDFESERDSVDFEQFTRHSSEEELSVINGRVIHPEKRKWSQMTRSSYGESSGSSDEEVRELLSQPQPVLFSSSPPRYGVKKCHFRHYKSSSKRSGTGTESSSKLYISPVRVVNVSPRKRHKKTVASGYNSDEEDDDAVQRPCLDFEKMQQVIYMHYTLFH